ncbi:MAG: SDR family NAD(P)-dependent oxidoreductase [Candidatus Aenigmarchaeota archaeon]|nr:SDR family NAD(P)-dependent oxidoreductase [Candidatus Aenigmarchaeota archaeon]
MKGKRILITGASGFIGSHLVERLAGGNDVHVILKGKECQRLSRIEDKINVHQGDVADRSFVKSVMDKCKPQIVFHLAGIIKKDASDESFAASMDVNFHGTLNLLMSLGKETERFVFVSTSEGYVGKAPFLEEDSRLPLSPYSASKMLAETACTFYFCSRKAPVTILRPFIVYGPGQDKGMLIPDAIMSMLGGKPLKTTKGEQTRDFVYIGDMVEALILTSSEKEAAGQTYNVCTGKETKIRDVVSEIARLTGGKSDAVLPYRENEVFSHFGDNSKLRSIGWEPKTGVHEGLKKTVEWYKNHASD